MTQFLIERVNSIKCCLITAVSVSCYFSENHLLSGIWTSQATVLRHVTVECLDGNYSVVNMMNGSFRFEFDKN